MYQRIILAGNLGGDPSQRFTATGAPVTTFSLAVSERKGETMWVRVSAWNKLAETCQQYLHKGARVLVEGRLAFDENGNPRVYERKDGTQGASFEVTASAVRFIGGKGDAPTDDVPF